MSRFRLQPSSLASVAIPVPKRHLEPHLAAIGNLIKLQVFASFTIPGVRIRVADEDRRFIASLGIKARGVAYRVLGQHGNVDYRPRTPQSTTAWGTQ